MEMGQGKVFEKPAAGPAVGTIIDVVDMPNCPAVYDGVPRLVNKVRILWILNNINGTPMLDKEGKQLTVAFIKPANMSPKADLYKFLVMLLGGAPPVITKTEELDFLIGRSNMLFITLSPNEKVQGDFFANVTGASPVPAGMVAPVAPQGFIRAKNQPKQVAGVATYATPQAAAQAVAQQPAATQPPVAQAPQNVQTPGAPATPAPGAPPNNVSF